MEASGLVPGHVLRRAGLPADLFEQPDDALLRLSDYFRICEQMALQGGDESCHVSLRPLMVGTSELVQARLRGCGTMAEVMEVLANSYNIIHGHRYNQVQRRGHLISYAIDDADFPYAFDPGDAFVLLSLECLLVYVHVLLLSLAPGGAPIPLRAVRTRGPAAARGHLAFLGVPIRASAGLFGLDYDAALETVGVSPAQSPVLSARTIYGGVADMLDRIGPAVPAGPDLVGRVERELAGGRHDQAEVATALGMSVASLRRRLGEAGLQFRDVRARYLNSIARAALEDGNSIADIAESLGFSDGRSFARAFRQWNGVAPGDYRKTLV
ncbi:AraC family transcriptional regulator [Rhizorhabdus dicambivorans]|uniref:AraC family transcriptional regulator n=2 Tax=Rhizorhabdus dicambivorans TaxID=1850238 RepID=A0A2A4FV10_9SPHN|nr:AraC family transcriptional regulator [Rhizorhabdus dicambivorans]PCE42275.1 AraC family transcriptional regulator [Rhizorhabdus dicambivorans]